MGIENVVKLFQPVEGRIIGLKCFEDKLYALSEKENSIFVYKKNNAEGYSLSDNIPVKIKSASGITTDGKALFIAGGIEKRVYRIDPNTGHMELYLDMRELKDNNYDCVIRARNSRINDIEILSSEMWVTCPAGYSSCIYRIDMNSLKIMQAIPARGPEPKSISLDIAAKCMRVLDSSNREISSYSFEGKWTGQLVRIPVESPACFSVDKNSSIVISSYSSEIKRKVREV